MPIVFVTGTDSGVGKTHVTSSLLRSARAAGVSACGYKPVASGCEPTPQGLRNEDALSLIEASATTLAYGAINPIALAPPIAPHIAAREAGIRIDPTALLGPLQRLVDAHDWVFVEGAGGWQVPLNDEMTFADWAARQGWPVLLVVGMRLGCLNHALLSAESILRRVPRLAWIANVLPPQQPRLSENLDDLRLRMPGTPLGVLPTAAAPVAVPQVFAAMQGWLSAA